MNKSVFSGSAVTGTMLALAFLAAAITSTPTIASEPSKDDVRLKFQRLTNIPTVAIEQAPLENMWQIVTNSSVFYATKDGKYIFSGALHDFESGLSNRSTSRLSEIHKSTIKELQDSFITYKAQNEKHHILVFYDAQCGYCKALHRELDDYLAKGITVSYAAFAALGPRSSEMLTHIWCSDDQHAALDKNANNQSFGNDASCNSPVNLHNDLGEAMGVNGTPAIFTLDGISVSRGYVDAARMESLLNDL